MKEYLLDLPLYLLYLSLWESKLPMKEKKYGSEYVNRELGTHIEKQMRILEVLLVKTLPKDKKLLNVIIPLFHSILDSCDSLILLSQRPKGKFPKIRDSFIISRTIIETIINVTFIFAKGEEASKQAEKHWLQRTIRDLDRGIKVGDQIIKLKWTGKENLKISKEIEEALKSFTTKRGKEITKWTPETIVDRLELISSKYGQEISKNLQMGFFGIYADASEIPHGTFYGSMILLGGAKPGGGPKNPREMETHLRKTLSHILLMTFISLNSLIKVLAAELNNQELEKKSKEILNSLFKEKWES